jgi:hypothetical protein
VVAPVAEQPVVMAEQPAAAAPVGLVAARTRASLEQAAEWPSEAAPLALPVEQCAPAAELLPVFAFPAACLAVAQQSVVRPTASPEQAAEWPSEAAPLALPVEHCAQAAELPPVFAFPTAC